MSGVNMRIDIDKLTEAELIDLNNRVVARLQFLNQMRAHAQMLEFKIGDRVSFQPDGHRRVVGMLTRYNRKTVTVITDDGSKAAHWEHSVALTEEGPLVLTAPDGGKAKLAEHGITAAPDPLA